MIRLHGVPLEEGDGSKRAATVRRAVGWTLVAAAAVPLALAYPLWRRWRAIPEMAEAMTEADEAQETLLQRIADLDEAFEAGEIPEAEYQLERTVLKRRLLGLVGQAARVEQESDRS